MAVDASRLKKVVRRGLGAPPTDGSPGIDETIKVAQEGRKFVETDASVLSPGAENTHIEANSSIRPGKDTEVVPPIRESFGSSEREGKEQPLGTQRPPRVPRLEPEPRIPFTTRISAITKERLEEACHHLRVKHQDFINQAIISHLDKHGF
jgi:hypothetical protein